MQLHSIKFSSIASIKTTTVCNLINLQLGNSSISLNLIMSLLRKYCTVHYFYSVNTVQYITVVHYLVRKYCAELTSVDSTDILCSTDISRIVRKYYTVLTSVEYCTVHYSRTLCHCYVNTVQYITYSVNTVQYSTVVCSTDISRQYDNDILCSTDQ